MDGGEVLGMSADNQQRLNKQAELKRNYEMRTRGEQYPLPTVDIVVQARLRQLNQKPIESLDEGVGERRERLRAVIVQYFLQFGHSPGDDTFKKSILDFEDVIGRPLSDDEKVRLQAERIITSKQEEEAAAAEEEEDEEMFYTEGSDALKEARLEIAQYSLPRAQTRLQKARDLRANLGSHQEEDMRIQGFLNSVPNYDVVESQYADTRVISRGCLSPDEKLFATSGWSGEAKVWGIPDCQLRTTLKGHTDRVVSVRFHPNSTQSLDPAALGNIATASADRTVRLWSLNPDKEMQESVALRGHEEIVNSVEFHPMGSHLASSSNDQTWRLWDIETQKELLIQEGHAGSVYPLTFQQDGALLASGDLQGVGLLWDLRTGQSILSFQEHQGSQLISMQFLPSGYQVAVAGDDNKIHFWDLRKRQTVGVLLAHQKLVSCVRFEQEARLMFSSSYDGKAKIWGAKSIVQGENTLDEWALLRTLNGHENKVTSVSHTRDLEYVITTSFDKTFKLWKRQ